jgi:hypothetical protein
MFATKDFKIIKKLFIWFWLLIFLIASPVWGANIYIDGSAGDGGNGTCVFPYNHLDDVTPGNASNDYYIRAGTTITITASQTFTTDGTSSEDKIKIGSYTWSAGPTCTPDSPGAAVTKPILNNTSGNSNTLQIYASYYHIFNLDIRHADSGGSYAAIRVRGDAAAEQDVLIEYNTMKSTGTDDMGYGVRAGLSNSTYDVDDVVVRYNDIDCNDQVDEAVPNGDGIHLGSHSDSSEAYGNKVKNCDHFGISVNGDSGVAYGNYIVDDLNSTLDGGLAAGVTSGTGGGEFYYNYVKDISVCVQINGHDGVIIHHNVCEGQRYFDGSAAIQVLVAGSNGADNVKIYNNTIYDYDTDMHCIKFVAGSGDTGTADNGEIINNICHTGGGANREAIKIADSVGKIDPSTYTIEGNNNYNSGDTDYAEIEGIEYTSAVDFDANAPGTVGDTTANVEEDPQLSNVAAGEFWPASGTSQVVDAGYNTGTAYDDYLISSTNPFAVPPVFNTQTETTHDIGAYTFYVGAPVQSGTGNIGLGTAGSGNVDFNSTGSGKINWP